MPEWLYPGGLVHLGEVLFLVCFLFRNQLLMRSFAIAGEVVYSTYYYVASDQPLWEAIWWSVPAIVINIVMIFVILRDARPSRFKDDALLLFRQLERLSPRQFKRLLKGIVWQVTDEATTLTVEGQKPEYLYFVLDGDVVLEKRGEIRPIPPRTFIGEIAFLQSGSASATVKVQGKSVVAKWPHGFLKALFAKDDELKSAFMAMVANDLACKLVER